MAVPDFQSFMLPALRLTADGKEHSLSELHSRLGGEMQLTSADLEEKATKWNADKVFELRPVEHGLSRQGRCAKAGTSWRPGDH